MGYSWCVYFFISFFQKIWMPAGTAQIYSKNPLKSKKWVIHLLQFHNSLDIMFVKSHIKNVSTDSYHDGI